MFSASRRQGWFYFLFWTNSQSQSASYYTAWCQYWKWMNSLVFCWVHIIQPGTWHPIEASPSLHRETASVNIGTRLLGMWIIRCITMLWRRLWNIARGWIKRRLLITALSKSTLTLTSRLPGNSWTFFYLFIIFFNLSSLKMLTLALQKWHQFILWRVLGI